MTQKKKSFKTPADVFLESDQEQITAKEAEKTVIPKGYKLVKETKSQRLQLLVRPTIKESLKELAGKKNISVNDLSNTIFEEYLERNGYN